MSRSLHMGERALVAWSVGLVVSILIYLSWNLMPWSTWDFGGQTAAAWVQAVGSIGAIAVTAGVTRWQLRVQHERDERVKVAAELASVEAIERLLGMACGHLNDADCLLSQGRSDFYYPSLYVTDMHAGTADALDAIPLTSAGGAGTYLLSLAGTCALPKWN